MPLIETVEEDSCDNIDPLSSGTGLLEKLVSSVRDSLGLELSPCTPIAEEQYTEDTLSDRTSFLRMVNRQHVMNSSNYSLSSVFSLGSVGGSIASLQGTRNDLYSLVLLRLKMLFIVYFVDSIN